MSGALVVIGGPTAAGKSAFATELARRVGGEIINADSVQIYRGLDVGSAKPTAEERAATPHHLLDVCAPDERYSAARFVADADGAIAEIRARGAVPIVVGGTGLYLRSLLFGLFEVDVPDAIRQAVRDELEAHGLAAAHERLTRVDPATAATVSARDAVRVARALEVFDATGVPISAHREAHGLATTRYEHVAVTVTRETDELRARIDARTAQMLAAGWRSEVAALLAAGLSPDSPGLSAVGYRQVVDVALGRSAAATLPREISAATRGLAKRQRTWFRGQWTSDWLDAADASAAAASLARLAQVAA